MKPIRSAVLFCGVLFGGMWLGAGGAEAASPYNGQVVADVLNIRGEPAIGAKIVGSLKKGDVVVVSDESYGWYKIESGKQKGWVAGQYVTKAAGGVKPTAAASGAAKSGGSTASAQSTTKSGASTSTAATNTSNSGQATSSQKGVVTADTLNMRKGPDAASEAVAVLRKGTELSISKRSNGWLQVRTPGGASGWVSGRYVDESGKAQTASVRSGSGLKGKLIVIDPGHGGSDPGAIGTTHKTMEKTINLTTAQYVAEELRRAGAQVVMTRTNDKDQPELSARASESNRRQADAFLSIHYNSSPVKVSGTLTYYYSDTKDKPLARSIEARLKSGVALKSNGIAYGNYHVLRENTRPSVLLELGFLTDSKDEGTVRKTDYQKKAAQAIALGLADYFSD